MNVQRQLPHQQAPPVVAASAVHKGVSKRRSLGEILQTAHVLSQGLTPAPTTACRPSEATNGVPPLNFAPPRTSASTISGIGANVSASSRMMLSLSAASTPRDLSTTPRSASVNSAQHSVTNTPRDLVGTPRSAVSAQQVSAASTPRSSAAHTPRSAQPTLVTINLRGLPPGFAWSAMWRSGDDVAVPWAVRYGGCTSQCI
jgi:hypothetical protein